MSTLVLDRAENAAGRRTLAENLRHQLADEIMTGVLAPGVALDETELARRFGVSRTPVREAIRLLDASGLVEARPHRAAVVAQPSPARLVGMFEAMAELEGLCATFAAERMTRTERQALESIHEKLRTLIHSGDPQRYHEMNEAFHAAIYNGAHNEYLAELTLGRLAKSHAEHDQVLTAILRGECFRAGEAMRTHITTVRKEYETYMRSL